MWRDDLDTAFRHLDLYDRFGCPGGHVQAAFRCLTRFGAQIDDKVPKSLDDRVHACWINPAAQPQAAAAAPRPAPSTAGNAARQPGCFAPAGVRRRTSRRRRNSHPRLRNDAIFQRVDTLRP